MVKHIVLNFFLKTIQLKSIMKFKWKQIILWTFFRRRIVGLSSAWSLKATQGWADVGWRTMMRWLRTAASSSFPRTSLTHSSSGSRSTSAVKASSLTTQPCALVASRSQLFVIFSNWIIIIILNCLAFFLVVKI